MLEALIKSTEKAEINNLMDIAETANTLPAEHRKGYLRDAFKQHVELFAKRREDFRVRGINI